MMGANPAHESEPGTQEPWSTTEGFFSAPPRFYAWTAPTPGWRAAEEGVCPCLPTLQCYGAAHVLSPNGHCP